MVAGRMKRREAEQKQRTAERQAREAVAASLAEGGAQRLTVLRLSRVTQPDYLEQRIDRAFQGELTSRLESLPCSFGTVDLSEGLDAAAQLLAKQSTGVKHLHVVSDFRQHD